ncbi:MAG: aldo/keto reductase family protein [Planctomycetes bacterium]|nr:aldo/keto reductase family protein [Planctomycetota bacterium]
MQYRKLGNSGLAVSTISLGSWLTFGNSVSEAEASNRIRHALDTGINLLDTADVYDMGEAERLLGRMLADVPRKDYVLATKCYFPTGDGPNDRGLSRKHVFESIDASLKRLGTDYVDLYQCHRYDPETPLVETIEAMNDLVRRGKTLYWGVSAWTANQLRQCVHACREHGYTAPISNQPPYNMLDRGIEHDVIPACVELGLGQIVYSPLAQGVLTGKYRRGGSPPSDSRAADPQRGHFVERYLSDAMLDAVTRLASVAADRGHSLAQLALAWCLRHKNVASVIVGAKNSAQLDENLAALEVDLDEELLREVEAILAETPSRTG